MTDATKPPTAPGSGRRVAPPRRVTVAALGAGAVVVAVVVVVVVVAWAVLGGDDGAPASSGASGDGCAEIGGGEGELAGAFGEASVTFTSPGGEAVARCLLLADTVERRRRGLMEVTDLALEGYDGMLFAFEGPTNGGFLMRNTRIPLSIAWFDQAGDLVGTADMEPCGDEEPDCPTYAPDAPYVTAVEVPQGRLREVGITEGTTLAVHP